MSLIDTLKSMGDLATGLGSMLPGHAGTAAKIAGIALGVGAEAAAAGMDPVVHVERLLKAAPAVRRVEDGWKDEIDAKFGPKP